MTLYEWKAPYLTMARCKYEWNAPHLLPPPSTKVESRRQRCILERGHREAHRSVTKVLHPLDEERRR